MFHCVRYFNNSELCSFARAAALVWADHWGYCGPAGINTAVYRRTDQIVCLPFLELENYMTMGETMQNKPRRTNYHPNKLFC